MKTKLALLFATASLILFGCAQPFLSDNLSLSVSRDAFGTWIDVNSVSSKEVAMPGALAKGYTHGKGYKFGILKHSGSGSVSIISDGTTTPPIDASTMAVLDADTGLITAIYPGSLTIQATDPATGATGQLNLSLSPMPLAQWIDDPSINEKYYLEDVSSDAVATCWKTVAVIDGNGNKINDLSLLTQGVVFVANTSRATFPSGAGSVKSGKYNAGYLYALQADGSKYYGSWEIINQVFTGGFEDTSYAFLPPNSTENATSHWLAKMTCGPTCPMPDSVWYFQAQPTDSVEW